MSDLPKSYDYAVHSDFLIHWTGKDIDENYDPRWADESHRSLPSEHVAGLYLRRLKDILTYGLWMTDEGEQRFRVGSRTITVPIIPKCCFTELKLSESRRHARKYGRLGIGVKRKFLFDRFGRPVTYVGFSERTNDKLLEACASDLTDKRLLNFFKPMNSDKNTLNNDLYSESEWRIILFEKLLNTKIIDPKDTVNEKEHQYYTSLTLDQKNKLKYLIPLDGWFSIIIYPSLAVKNPAQWNKGQGIGISEEIRRIKQTGDHGNMVEDGNWPIEIDLDACRHF